MLLFSQSCPTLCNPMDCSMPAYIQSTSCKGLDELQAGIKITRRNTNNLRYVDDIALMAESEEELKSFLMKVKEESEKAGLKPSFPETKIMAASPITSGQIEGKKVEAVTDFIFSVQFSSVAQSCPTLCDPMNCSTPGFSVYHQLQELAQNHQFFGAQLSSQSNSHIHT